jgi:hypothetical protein
VYEAVRAYESPSASEPVRAYEAVRAHESPSASEPVRATPVYQAVLATAVYEAVRVYKPVAAYPLTPVYEPAPADLAQLLDVARATAPLARGRSRGRHGLTGRRAGARSGRPAGPQAWAGVRAALAAPPRIQPRFRR